MAELIGIIFGSFNLFTPIWIACGALVGAMIYMMLAQPKKNIVWKVSPNNHYGYDFNIDSETPFGMKCKGFRKQPPQRFFKYLPSVLTYYQDWKGRTQTLIRWVGAEGTAFTQLTRTTKKLDKDGVLVDLSERVTLVEALRTLWDDEFWKSVPEDKKKLVEDAKIGVTVALEDKELPDWKDDKGNPTKLVSLTEDNTMNELDLEAAATDWQGKKSAMKGTTLNYILAVGAGVGLGLGLALILGWIQLAPKPSVSQFILGAIHFVK